MDSDDVKNMEKAMLFEEELNVKEQSIEFSRYEPLNLGN
jgi:hypothetical protein